MKGINQLRKNKVAAMMEMAVGRIDHDSCVVALVRGGTKDSQRRESIKTVITRKLVDRNWWLNEGADRPEASMAVKQIERKIQHYAECWISSNLIPAGMREELEQE